MLARPGAVDGRPMPCLSLALQTRKLLGAHSRHAMLDALFFVLACSVVQNVVRYSFSVVQKLVRYLQWAKLVLPIDLAIHRIPSLGVFTSDRDWVRMHVRVKESQGPL